MSLLDRINDDFKIAMKGQQASTLSTLRMLKAALKNRQIELMRNLEDADVLAVLQIQAKQLHESFEGALKAGRAELAEGARAELEMIKRYLPEGLKQEEVEAIVKETVAQMQATAKDIGKVIGQVMQVVKGRADGKLVQELVKKILR
ncbi:MAG: GatB/YqeY domain-containing protein [Patescibacteria group bacterium]